MSWSGSKVVYRGKRVNKLDGTGTILETYISLGKAAKSVPRGDKSNIRKAIASGDMMYNYYWEFTGEQV